MGFRRSSVRAYWACLNKSNSEPRRLPVRLLLVTNICNDFALMEEAVTCSSIGHSY